MTIPAARKWTGGEPVQESGICYKVPGGLKGNVPVPKAMVPVAEQAEYIVLQ